jgi:DNA-directed RNA polymerase sigma subunit (sigma70/sigma32)
MDCSVCGSIARRGRKTCSTACAREHRRRQRAAYNLGWSRSDAARKRQSRRMWLWYHGERGVCLTREQVAKRLRLSVAQVEAIELRALKKLRQRLIADGISAGMPWSDGSNG